MQLSKEERTELETILEPYAQDALVQSMAGFVQHGSVSTLDHCHNVCEVSWWMCRRLHLEADPQVLAVGALLHDFYLYDWHGAGWRHSYRHAERARRIAASHFGVDTRTQDVIRCHMWPFGITHVPRSREAVVVSLADKYVSLHETLFSRRKVRRICG